MWKEHKPLILGGFCVMLVIYVIVPLLGGDTGSAILGMFAGSIWYLYLFQSGWMDGGKA